MSEHTLDKDIEQTLLAIAEALGRGDAAGVAENWSVPALVLSAEGATAVAKRSEVEKFFTASVADYRKRGQFGVRPELVRVDAITPEIAAVDVRWHALDEQGGEVGESEVSHYLLQRDDDEKFRVRVATSREG